MSTKIGFSGVGSGIDFNIITDAIIAQRSRPIFQLTSKKNGFQNTANELKKLNTLLIAFKDKANTLTDRTLATARTASTTLATVATATAATGATTGPITVSVTRLASALQQQSGIFTSQTAPVLVSPDTTAVFELRKGGAATGTSFTIDATNNTLTGLRDAINNAKAGVTANIVDVSGNGTQFRLSLVSAATGTAGRVELFQTNGSATLTGLGITTVNPTSGVFADLDASLTVNGLGVTRSSNTISDVITGVTFELKGPGSATVTVSPDTDKLKTKIGDFVDSFNEIQDFINGQFKKDNDNRPTGILVGDPTLNSVKNELRNIVNPDATNTGGPLTNLTQIGVLREKDGRLSVDQTIINTELGKSLENVSALFSGKTTSNSGIANRATSSLTGLSDAVNTAVTGFDTSIKSIDKSITEQKARLDQLRASLQKRFAAADAAIGQLNAQSASLSNVLLQFTQPRR